MFGAVRLILGCIITVLIILLCKRIAPKCRIRIVYVIILFVIVISILMLIPVENVIIGFKSPETAFRYSSSRHADGNIVVTGNQSAFVVATKESTDIQLIVPKTKKGWGIGIGLHTKHVESLLIEGFAIDIYQYRDTGDFYIRVFDANGSSATIEDSCGSNFLVTEKRNDSVNKTYRTYYAYIPNYNEQYELYIGDKGTGDKWTLLLSPSQNPSEFRGQAGQGEAGQGDGLREP